ncbi:MAG: DinB family protein, partial [Phycisphaerae bacterium]|nr:DinB family protein [Phycisphaerae bacterium]
MTSAPEALAASIENAARLLLWLTEDLHGADWLHRPCPKANCAAWTVGHLVLSSRMMMQRAGTTDLPALPEGFEKRFARDESAPSAAEFGDTSILRPLFQQHHDRFAAVARALTVQQL